MCLCIDRQPGLSVAWQAWLSSEPGTQTKRGGTESALCLAGPSEGHTPRLGDPVAPPCWVGWPNQF